MDGELSLAPLKFHMLVPNALMGGQAPWFLKSGSKQQLLSLLQWIRKKTVPSTRCDVKVWLNELCRRSPSAIQNFLIISITGFNNMLWGSVMFGFFFQWISIARTNKMLTCQEEYIQPSYSMQEFQIIQRITRRIFLWTELQDSFVQVLALSSLY